MDLVSVVLTLRPVEPEAREVGWWGKAAHALALSLLREADPALAEGLHGGDQGPRPFTTSTLMGPGSRKALKADQDYLLRLTGLRRDVSAVFLEAAEGGRLKPGETLELNYQKFRVQSAARSAEEHPWAGTARYEELGAEYLLAGRAPGRRLGLAFTSPVSFKSSGRWVPLPLPELVFGSLLERWNAFAPIALPYEARRYAEECLGLGRYRLSTRAVAVEGRGLRIGAVGKVQYNSLNYDRYWMSTLQALAAFARYAGAGSGTTMGFGQARVMHGAWE